MQYSEMMNLSVIHVLLFLMKKKIKSKLIDMCRDKFSQKAKIFDFYRMFTEFNQTKFFFYNYLFILKFHKYFEHWGQITNKKICMPRKLFLLYFYYFDINFFEEFKTS